MDTAYSAGDLTNVATKDTDTVGQVGTSEYLVHQFKDYTGGNACNLEWQGQTTLAPATSAVNLQIYNRNSSTWETIDTDNTSPVDTDFILMKDMADLTNYKDNNTVIVCRVYQEAI